MKEVDLSKFNNDWYDTGAGKVKRLLWFLVNGILLQSRINAFSSCKVCLLRLFGARVGNGVVIKPSVNIKYPWLLSIGDNVWIGERVWIDNLAKITIGNNVCLSQGAMLLCGNHDYKKEGFDLMVGEIVLENGVWIGAHSVVCPSVCCASHSVLSVNSVAVSDLKAYKIYQGNPAVEVRERKVV